MTYRLRNLSEQEFTALVKKRDRDAIDAVVPLGGKTFESKFKSKLEAAFSQRLEFEKRASLLSYVAYEPLNLRLPGRKNFYKPDFLVVHDDGRLTFYEVKGFSRSNDRSLVKLKTAAGMTPWARFILVKRIKGEWIERVII